MSCFQHEAIAEFPSQLYYKGQLECGLNEQTKLSAVKFWPNGRNKPIAFVHIVGEEICQSVATEEGGMMSRSNLKEALLAVSVLSMSRVSNFPCHFHILCRSI